MTYFLYILFNYDYFIYKYYHFSIGIKNLQYLAKKFINFLI